MKAIRYTKYGSPNELKLVEIEIPKPKNDEVLVQVKAASINSWDYDLLIGTNINRLITLGFSKPKIKILGCDISGIVESIGKDVKELKVGDEVFGDISGGNWGGFAEFACAKENILAIKSKGVSFVEAASTPQAAVLALQSLNYNGQTKSGDKILINGAGGGVGTFGLQMAKHYGAEVTCVDKANKLDMLKSLGADHVIDYISEDFTRSEILYDRIIDNVANRSIFKYKKVLAPNGKFIMVGGTNSSLLQTLFFGPIISKFSSRKMGILKHIPNKTDLRIINNYMESGIITPKIDSTFHLHETAEAFSKFGEGNFFGKIVIKI